MSFHFSPLELLTGSALLSSTMLQQELPKQKQTLIFDAECYFNVWQIGFKRVEDGKRILFEFSDRKDFDRVRVRKLLRNNLIIGFNSENYDLPMIYYALGGASNAELKELSDRIIKGGLKPWDAEREYGFQIPKNLDHIDLFSPNPSTGNNTSETSTASSGSASLKTLNGRLHGERLQDLPYEPDSILTHAEMDLLGDYCKTSDLDATHNLYDSLREPINLRIGLGKQYGVDFRSKSDAQMGEGIVRKAMFDLTGKKLQKAEIKIGSSFKYNIPDFITFETPEMRHVLDVIRETRFVIGKGGSVQLPPEITKLKVKIGDTEYQMGIGGLHSKEKTRGVVSDDEYILLDADVASQYPSIIMKLGLFPKAVGREFLKIYRGLIDKRLAAKKSGDTITNLGLKISINGIYGKLGSGFSFLYAPHLLIATTLTGQLTLLMLIERMESIGISVVSANTDGVVFKCPRTLFNGFVQKDGKDTDRMAPAPVQDIIEWWEKTTSFNLEFAEYAAVYSRDVNCYVAIKPNGKAKRKGTIANHWEEGSPDRDPTYQMKKNPKMTVCGDAALAHIMHGTPVDQFIREYRDIRGFVTVVNATGGATWRDGYLGKVVRYYWSTDGDPIIKRKGHHITGNKPKVPDTDGCRPAMNLPAEFPTDIDYQHYVDFTNDILRDIGFTVDPEPCPFEEMLLRIPKKRKRKVAA